MIIRLQTEIDELSNTVKDEKDYTNITGEWPKLVFPALELVLLLRRNRK